MPADYNFIKRKVIRPESASENESAANKIRTDTEKIMTFETNRDVLARYEKQPRALTEEFVSAIDWKAIKNHALDKRFVSVQTSAV